jgi:hypothetical protein
MPKPECDMVENCPNPITHIGEKGFIYCAEHAPCRNGFERTRRMRPWEIKLLDAGKQLPSYRPLPKKHFASEVVNA